MPYFSHLDQPVSAEAPCGIDLDADPDLQSFLTMAESSLPERYSEFDRKAFDAKTYIEKIDGFLKKSRDVRLLVFAIKTFALTDNLPGFFESLAAMTKLLEQNWTDAFPRPAEGDYTLRSAYIQSLDERATMLFPLQVSTLIKDKRLGNIAYRAFMLAQKPALAKAGETAHDEATLFDTFVRFEPLDELLSLHGQFKTATENLKKLRELFIEHAGYEAAPKFELLSAFLGEVEAVLGKALNERSPPEAVPEVSDGTAGEAGEQTEGGAATASAIAAIGDLKSVKEASNALKAIVAYYAAFEPSSPAKLLIRQAPLSRPCRYLHRVWSRRPKLTSQGQHLFR
jgi:type VI secretion system protein ImpA